MREDKDLVHPGASVPAEVYPRRPDRPSDLEDAEFEAFIAAIDASLTEAFGPDHQRILSSGRTIAALEW